MNEKALRAEIERLTEQVRKLSGPKLSLKISAKRALSLYGIGRFPITLYRDDWVAVLGYSDEIKKFILENDHQLVSKGEALKGDPPA